LIECGCGLELWGTTVGRSRRQEQKAGSSPVDQNRLGRVASGELGVFHLRYERAPADLPERLIELKRGRARITLERRPNLPLATLPNLFRSSGLPHFAACQVSSLVPISGQF